MTPGSSVADPAARRYPTTPLAVTLPFGVVSSEACRYAMTVPFGVVSSAGEGASP